MKLIKLNPFPAFTNHPQCNTNNMSATVGEGGDHCRLSVGRMKRGCRRGTRELKNWEVREAIQGQGVGLARIGKNRR